MCTAISDNGKFHLFGRTLDMAATGGEDIVAVPRGFCFERGSAGEVITPFAMMGMAHMLGEQPLYYDAVNECGLAAAALNFGTSAVYEPAGECEGLPSFAVIPTLLSLCTSVEEVRALAEEITVSDEAAGKGLPVTPLHWLVADRTGAVVLEPLGGTLTVSDAPLGVMTNAPDYGAQLLHLSDYQSLTPAPPENLLCPDVALPAYGFGAGTVGLPGDFSSRARFVRAAFVKRSTLPAVERKAAVARFFHMLGAVSVPCGCVIDGRGGAVRTVYSCCMDIERLQYHYTTYEDPTPTTVTLWELLEDGED